MVTLVIETNKGGNNLLFKFKVDEVRYHFGTNGLTIETITQGGISNFELESKFISFDDVKSICIT